MATKDGENLEIVGAGEGSGSGDQNQKVEEGKENPYLPTEYRDAIEGRDLGDETAEGPRKGNSNSGDASVGAVVEGIDVQDQEQSEYSKSDPTREMLQDPLWNAIWDKIKMWDVNVPDAYAGYMGVNGNHCTMIYNAMMGAIKKLGLELCQRGSATDTSSVQLQRIPKSLPRLPPEAEMLIREISTLAWNSGFFIVGGFLPVKMAISERKEDMGQLIPEIDVTRENGTFANVGERNEHLVSKLMMMLAQEKMANDYANRMASRMAQSLTTRNKGEEN